jgi:hypothetical protein
VTPVRTRNVVSRDVTPRSGLPYGQARSTLGRLVATDTHGARKAASPPADRASRRSPADSAITLTGRGGVVVVFACTLLGAIIGSLLGLHPAQGFLFVVGCLLAVVTTRRTDLLTLVVSPPLIFFLVSLLVAVTGSLGEKSFLVSMLLTLVTTLTSSMPWLFVGAVLVVVVAVPRGLPANLRELSAGIAADNPFRGRTSLRGRRDKKVEDDDPVRWDETP